VNNDAGTEPVRCRTGHQTEFTMTNTSPGKQTPVAVTLPLASGRQAGCPARRRRSADFQVCCIAGCQTCGRCVDAWPANLKSGMQQCWQPAPQRLRASLTTRRKLVGLSQRRFSPTENA
jgi:hypothetical protein